MTHECQPCPCCGQRTIGEPNQFEICAVCGWEDDGQTEKDADVVRGGPNGKFNLTLARQRFLDSTTNKNAYSVLKPRLKETLAMHVLNLLTSDQVIDGIYRALTEDKLETPTLILLAGWSSPTFSEISPHIEKMLEELKWKMPNRDEARFLVAKLYAGAIHQGQIDSFLGGRFFWKHLCKELEERGKALEHILHAASEMEYILSGERSNDGTNLQLLSMYDGWIHEQAKEILKMKAPSEIKN